MQTKTIVDSILESDSKYSELAKDPDVLHWLRNLERGGAVTADASIRRLGRSCELLGWDIPVLRCHFEVVSVIDLTCGRKFSEPLQSKV